VRLLEPDTGPPASGPARLVEPDPPEPPRHGKGSSRQAWADHADQLGVLYPPGAERRAIIAAVDHARQAAA
jgi:hypothetical protein